MEKKEKQKIGTDFTEGDITLMLLRFLLPFLLANLLTSIYNTVDMMVIGQYSGGSGTVAVSLGGKVMTMLTSLSIGLAGGGQVLLSQQLGAKQEKEMGETVKTLLSLLAVISAFLMVFCLLFARPILTLLNTPQVSYEDTWRYFVITSVGLPLVFGYNGISAVLRGMGDSRHPLMFIAAAATANLVLDAVFVVFLEMGVAGTALATVIGQGISLILSLYVFWKHRQDFGISRIRELFHIYREKLRIILSIGVPLACKSGLIGLTQIFMMSIINLYGVVQAAAYGVGDKIFSLTNIVCTSCNSASGTMIAQNIGAGRYGRAKKVIFSTLKITLLNAFVLSLVALCMPEAMLRCFTKDAEVLAYSVPMMRISMLTYFMSALTSVCGAATTGTGNAKLALLAGVLDGVVFRISFGLFFGIVMDMQVIGFYLGNTLARLGPLIVEGVYLVTGRWRTYGVLVEQESRTGC